MGTSLFEQYQAEKGEGPSSLYDEYLKSRKDVAQAPRESLKLDVRQRPESTKGLSYDPERGGDLEAVGPSALGLVTTGAQFIPGLERLQAGARALVRGQPYREALDDMRSVTDPIPAPIKLAAQAPGILKASLGLALSPAKAGAVIGAADQALSADEMPLSTRAGRTALASGAGAGAGKLIETVGTAMRALRTPTPDANIVGRQTIMRAKDAQNYGRAASEGAAAGPSSGIQNALAAPDVKPFADMVRQSRQFANADDATVLRETYKLMSKHQSGLARKLREQGFDAEQALKHEHIALAKQELLKAADAVMPSFRQAVQEHATARAGMDGVDLGRKVGSRLTAKSSGAKPATQSPAALRERIERMSPEDRKAVVQGILGRLREQIGVQPNWVSMGGALTTAVRPARVAPYLRSIKDPATQRLDKIVRAGLLSAGGGFR